MSGLDRALTRVTGRLAWGRRGLWFADERAWVPPPQAAAALGEWLYRTLFTGWLPPTGRFARDVAGAPAFVEQLVRRVTGVCYLDDRFRVAQRTPTGTFVHDGVVRLWVEERGGLRPPAARVGQRVAVKLPCARPAAVPGFFTVVSRAGRLPDGAHLKAYLNLSADGALELVEGLLHSPALRRARFEAKVVNDPGAYRRRDTALLYVEPSSWRAVTAWLVGFHAHHRRLFRAGTPPLTLPLAAGVSAVESPTGDESFGEHRCRLIAQGLLAALRRAAAAKHGPVAWRRAVEQRFAREALRFDEPWLGSLGASWVDQTPRRWL